MFWLITFSNHASMYPTAAPASPPQDVVVVAVDSRTFTLGWNPPLPDDHNGIITEYRISVTGTETEETTQFVTVETALTVQSLHPYYTYTCAVAAFTILEGPYSSAISVTMPQDGKRLTSMHRYINYISLL